jgi:type VI secretion system protein ImpC
VRADPRPQAGGAVKDLPIHLYDLGTGNQVKFLPR